MDSSTPIIQLMGAEAPRIAANVAMANGFRQRLDAIAAELVLQEGE